jgi:hypothetical protein
MALKELYVDPSIAADSGTGTIGDPYGDLQYAFATDTWSTSGVRINIKAGTAEVLTAALDVSTGFGAAPANTAAFVIQGYTTVQGDGDWDAQTGIAEIDCNGFTFLADATLDFMQFVHLKIGGSAAGGYVDLIKIDDWNLFLECEIHTHGGSGELIEVSLSNTFLRCYFHTVTAGGSYGVRCTSASNTFESCYFIMLDWDYPTWAVFGTGSYNGRAENNVVVTAGKSRGFYQGSNSGKCIGNSFYSTGSQGGIEGIYLPATSSGNGGMIVNNVVEGFKNGMRLWGGAIGVFSGNYVAKCELANYDVTCVTVTSEDNEDSTISPFRDAANYDFRPRDVGNMKEGWPPSIATYGNRMWKGAIQLAPTERRPARRSARRPARR